MIVTGGIIPLGSGIALIARIVGNLGQPITQASLAAISYALTNLGQGVSLGAGTFAVAASVFDSLQQTDPRWTFDGPTFPGSDGLWGYNFLATLPAAAFPPVAASPANIGAAPQQVQCTVTFTPVSGEPFVFVAQWKQLLAYNG